MGKDDGSCHVVVSWWERISEGSMSAPSAKVGMVFASACFTYVIGTDQNAVDEYISKLIIATP